MEYARSEHLHVGKLSLAPQTRSLACMHGRLTTVWQPFDNRLHNCFTMVSLWLCYGFALAVHKIEFFASISMKIRRETIVAVAMLAPTLDAYRAMHLAHNAFDASSCRQYCVRVRFREWRRKPATAYKLESRRQVLHGKHADGHWLAVRDDGSCFAHKYIIEGRLHGKCMYYWRGSGVVSERDMYHHGRMHGLWVSWSRTGLVRWHRHYVDDARHGDFTIYDDNGRVLKTITYEHGRIVTQNPPKPILNDGYIW